jgi:hypothetical protein
MVCIVSLYDSLVLPYLAWFVSYHVMLHWFIIAGHGLYCFTSISGSSLLGMVFIVSLPSQVRHYWAWFVLFHFMHHGSVLLCMVFIISLHVSLILPY